MIPLEPSDIRHLKAAEGWIELGDLVSAHEELDEIEPEARAHPAVLKLRCQMYVKAKKWDMAAEIAKALTELLPEDPKAWIDLAEALRHRPHSGLSEAKELLLQVEHMFPREYSFPFNLARYCAQLRQFEEAQEWFKKAMVVDSKTVQNLALWDDDLKPLWDSMSGTLWKKE